MKATLFFLVPPAPIETPTCKIEAKHSQFPSYFNTCAQPGTIVTYLVGEALGLTGHCVAIKYRTFQFYFSFLLFLHNSSYLYGNLKLQPSLVHLFLVCNVPHQIGRSQQFLSIPIRDLKTFGKEDCQYRSTNGA